MTGSIMYTLEPRYDIFHQKSKDILRMQKILFMSWQCFVSATPNTVIISFDYLAKRKKELKWLPSKIAKHAMKKS